MVKTILVAGGHYALVDDDDYIWLNYFSWFLASKGQYASTEMKYKDNGITKYCRHKMHRLINRTPEGSLTDHINGIKHDNTKTNLRTVTDVQNRGNIHHPMRNKFLPGVFAKGNKFRSRIIINGKDKNLGYFDTPEQAHAAYMIEKEKVKAKLFEMKNEISKI